MRTISGVALKQGEKGQIEKLLNHLCPICSYPLAFQASPQSYYCSNIRACEFKISKDDLQELKVTWQGLVNNPNG